MVWTQEKLAQFPEPYRDFMRMLKPVIDTRKPGTVMRITGVSIGRIYGAFFEEYDYGPEQVRQLADNLLRAGYVREDQMGVFTPTDEGEAIILALAAKGTTNGCVPPLPIFSES